MKRRVLLIFISWVFLNGFMNGQNVLADNPETGSREIYILGTFHFREHNFEKYPQDINREIERAIEYMPDIVCVEWINKSEELDLYQKDYTENIGHFLEAVKLDTAKAPFIIDSLYRKLAEHPDDMESRSEIANYLYVTRDYINACYQWYLIENKAKDSIQLKKLLPEKISQYRYSLYEDPEAQKREIVEVAFPVAASMAHEKIYSIDYRHDQEEYSSCINKFCEPYEKENGYDPMLKKAESLINAYNQWLESDRISGASTYYEKLNSKENEHLMFAYYYDMFLSFGQNPDYKKWHELQLEQRNWHMFELLIQAISESDAQKIFVLVGTTHKIYLERYLKETDQFCVTGYSDLK
jgi:hypothetical protein